MVELTDSLRWGLVARGTNYVILGTFELDMGRSQEDPEGAGGSRPPSYTLTLCSSSTGGYGWNIRLDIEWLLQVCVLNGWSLKSWINAIEQVEVQFSHGVWSRALESNWAE